MTANRTRMALAVVFLSIGLSTGTAVALNGTPTSGGDSLGDNEQQGPEAPPQGETLPEVVINPEAPVAPSGGSLPITGADVAQLTVIGLGAIGVGTVMARRSRANRVTA